MAQQYFATRSGASRLVGKDYRTINKYTEPDALLVRRDGKLVSLFAVDPSNGRLLSEAKKDK
jgi:hypothetical protein